VEKLEAQPLCCQGHDISQAGTNGMIDTSRSVVTLDEKRNDLENGGDENDLQATLTLQSHIDNDGEPSNA
jgi:hypothetical protein